MVKRSKAAVFVIMVVLMLSGCGNNSATITNDFSDNPKRIIFEEINIGIVSPYIIFVDRETGVTYIHLGEAGATPLYNADGSLYIANGWRDEGE